MKRRLLLTGASGLLGRHLLPALQVSYNVLPVANTNAGQVDGAQIADLTDAPATRDVLNTFLPEIIVHAAALANVDQCEREQVHAWRTNVEVIRTLADWCAERRPAPYLMYISTDQVYDGPGPHRETDAAPANVYALTKLWGEQCAALAPRSISVRTNFFMRGGGLAGVMERGLANDDVVTLFEDVLFNPLYVDDLADILLKVIELAPTGVVNVGASGPGLSKADFVRGMAKRLGLPLDKARPGRASDAKLRAYRPSDMRMDVGRLIELIGMVPPSVETGLDRMCEQPR